MFFSSIARTVSGATATAGARPALAGIITSLPYVRAKPSAIWLRQALPIHTNSTRFLPAGIIASPETGSVHERPWSVPDGRSPPEEAPARSAPDRLRTPPALAHRSRPRG